MSEIQGSLFDSWQVKEIEAARYGSRPAEHHLSADSLRDWQQRIVDWQQGVRREGVAPALDLFGNPLPGQLAEAIEPLTLVRRSLNFWRWPSDASGTAAIYFVIDYERELLLYVGETCKADQRWKGEHDCKRYVASYQGLANRLGVETAVAIAFWMDAPTRTRERQQLESDLIRRWRSPFNKENWRFWGTPFVH